MAHPDPDGIEFHLFTAGGHHQGQAKSHGQSQGQPQIWRRQ
jgi:hypothetical protein